MTSNFIFLPLFFHHARVSAFVSSTIVGPLLNATQHSFIKALLKEGFETKLIATKALCFIRAVQRFHQKILSHTWGGDDEEAYFRDIKNGSGKTKDGYKKLQFCGQEAARNILQYFWVACYIDKSNNN